MHPKRSFLLKMTHQLIYVIVVATLVALSLKAVSKEPVKRADYLNVITLNGNKDVNVTEVTYHRKLTTLRERN